MSISIENLSKFYGSQAAVNDLSFTASEGEILGLLGPNGAGKTTTMKIMSCFMPPSQGSAEIYGYDILKNPLEIKSILGYLPEHNPLYENMYVKEYLAFVAGIHRLHKPSKRIKNLIEQTGLEREQSKKIGQLSKGYRQRVGIAQAIIHDPKLLILDEPISGLDPNQLIEIRSLIKSLKKNKTIIFSSHILQEVESICDRVLILDQGQLVADKAIGELSMDAEQLETTRVRFMRALNQSELSMIEKLCIGFKSLDNKTFLLSSKQGEAIQERIFDFAVDHSNKITELYTEKEKLESVFKQMTKKKNT